MRDVECFDERVNKFLWQGVLRSYMCVFFTCFVFISLVKPYYFGFECLRGGY